MRNWFVQTSMKKKDHIPLTRSLQGGDAPLSCLICEDYEQIAQFASARMTTMQRNWLRIRPIECAIRPLMHKDAGIPKRRTPPFHVCHPIAHCLG
jgi:hypothetical protein